MRYGSLFSGIEAASLAWRPLGWTCAWVAENDPFCCAVLKHHYPDVPNLGDVTKVNWDAVEPVDVIIGGSPCQSFSIAGKRLGLDDPRGNLALIMLQIIGRVRPTWLCYENVPGLLSSDEGRDFGAFLGLLGELGYGFAYRVLDAQHGGVPQRRRRLWVVGHSGGQWQRAAAVLFDEQSLHGDPAPGRQAGERVAPSLTVGAHGCDGHQYRQKGNENALIAAIQERAVCENAEAGPDGAGIRTDGQAYTLEARSVPQAVAFGGIAHSLTAEGFDAGTGRGAVPVPIALDWKNSAGGPNSEDTFMTLSTERSPAVLSFTGGASDCISAEDLAQPVTGRNGDPGMIAIQDISGRDKKQNGRGWNADGTAYTVDAVATQGVAGASGVRRLTPVECERLMAMPDGYTLVPYRGKLAADGPRYKAIGNSMVVSEVSWIGKRIQMVEEISEKEGKSDADQGR